MIPDGNDVLLKIIEHSGDISEDYKSVKVRIPGTKKHIDESEKKQLENFFRHVYLIDPEEIKDNPVIHPEYIRYPSEKDIYKEPIHLEKGDWSRYILINGKEFRAAKNNVRAKYAFRDYTNINLTNDKLKDRLYGYTVAHIFGGADNPLLFTAGFNLALILDGFVKFSDEQHLNPIFFWALTSAAYLLNEDVLQDLDKLHIRYELEKSDVKICPLFPQIQEGKLVKEKSRIIFEKVEPFPFWFRVKTIKKQGRSYEISEVKPNAQKNNSPIDPLR